MTEHLSTAEENYIKTIYHLQQTEANASTNEVAAKLNTKAASVTDMIKRLNAKQLINYEKYKGVTLSAEGEKIAIAIIRKHRLWEYFLVEKLQFKWDEVHEIAEELEHISSKQLVERLDSYLGYPKFDPHGDPIPDSKGNIQFQEQINLTDLSIDQQATVSAVVGSQSSALLELLTHKDIGIGSKIVVKKRFSFDNSLEIQTNKDNVFTISKELAMALFVKKMIMNNR